MKMLLISSSFLQKLYYHIYCCFKAIFIFLLLRLINIKKKLKHCCLVRINDVLGSRYWQFILTALFGQNIRVLKVIIVNRVSFAGFVRRLLPTKHVFALSNYRRFKMLIKHVVFSEQHVECLMMTTCTPAIYLCTLLTRRFNWFLSWQE